MNSVQLRLLADDASSVLWRVEDHIRAGMSFEAAKARAIAEAEPSWRGLAPATARDARYLAHQISIPDLSRRTYRILADRVLADIEASRGRRAGPVERAFYALTGMTW